MPRSILELKPDAWNQDQDEVRPGPAHSGHVTSTSPPEELQRVVVVGVGMRLGEMIKLAMKWGVACLVAGLVFSLVGGALYFVVVTVLPSLANR